MTAKTYSVLPFFTPVTSCSDGNKEEKFAVLGRFAEQVWNFKGRKVMTIVQVSEYSDMTIVKKAPREKKDFLTTVLKLAALVLFFPFILGLKIIYRCQNKFVVEQIQLLKKVQEPTKIQQNNEASQQSEEANNKKIEILNPPISPAQKVAPIQQIFPAELPKVPIIPIEAKKCEPEITANIPEIKKIEESEKKVDPQTIETKSVTEVAEKIVEITKPLPTLTEEQILKKKQKEELLKVDKLFWEGKLYLDEEKYDKALESFARFLIKLDSKADNRKKDALEQGLQCLIELGLLSEDLIAEKTDPEKFKDFRAMFTTYKEFRQETDPAVVASKLSKLGKISLSKALKVPEKLVPVSESPDIVDVVGGIHLHNESSNETFFPYAVSSTAGLPGKAIDDPYMEDRYLVTSFKIEQKDKEPIDVQLFGVFDGHADSTKETSECAEIVKQSLSRYLKSDLDSKDSLSDLNLWNAIKLAPVKINYDKNIPSGTTYCFAILFKDPQTNADVVWSANGGDSRILCTGAQCMQLSTDARYRDEASDENPANKKFLTSIQLRDGYVAHGADGIYRLGNVVEPLRGIGHNPDLGNNTYGKIKGFSSRPEIMKVDTSQFKEDLRLVLFTDGTSEVIGSQEVMDIIQGVPVARAANKLVEHAIKLNSQDNNTVMVVDIKRNA